MTHAPAVDRYPDRPLNVRGTRHDVCPECGGERDELLIAPDLFYCEECRKSTPGPNDKAPEPEAPALFSVSDLGVEDGPPLDEGMAWVGEEGPDE